MDRITQELISAGLADPKPRPLIGVVGNKPIQSQAIVSMDSYDLAIVEFDDQGRCFDDRSQIKAVAARERDAIIVVFVHGWKHNARTDDTNLIDFCKVLENTANYEANYNEDAPRPVLGVFVGWRGMSLHDRFSLSDNLTFWDRQQAGRRVAVGSVRELMGRFRHYHNARVDSQGAPLVVIVGHSFGGMIVYSALAQSLIEAASTPRDKVTPRFADLVLLVNPAIEAIRYLPIYDLVRERTKKQLLNPQAPVFLCVTATNDWATRVAFPLGNVFSMILESYRGREERQAMINTIGHVPWLKTHELVKAGGETDYELKAVDSEADTPFWVIQADSRVVNGHNEIFEPPFLRFLAELLFEHVEETKAKSK
jgi:hypothetical protein